MDIIRDIVNGKLNYLSEEFYIEEAKEKREDATFRYKFQDVIDVASEKAQILKARGITSKKTAKVAATQATATGQVPYNLIVENSPPKMQQPATGCDCCQSTQHSIQNCNKLGSMKIENVMAELRRFQYCFRCMHKGHIAKFCKNKAVKCGKCNFFGHPTILHGIKEFRQQQQQQGLATSANPPNQPSTSSNGASSNNSNTHQPQPNSVNQPTNPANRTAAAGGNNQEEAGQR